MQEPLRHAMSEGDARARLEALARLGKGEALALLIRECKNRLLAVDKRMAEIDDLESRLNDHGFWMGLPGASIHLDAQQAREFIAIKRGRIRSERSRVEERLAWLEADAYES